MKTKRMMRRRKKTMKKTAARRRKEVKRLHLRHHPVEAAEEEVDPRGVVALATLEEGQGKSDSRKFGLVFVLIEFLGCS
jgi:hypothetical protein